MERQSTRVFQNPAQVTEVRRPELDRGSCSAFKLPVHDQRGPGRPPAESRRRRHEKMLEQARQAARRWQGGYTQIAGADPDGDAWPAAAA
eukprot:SAG22_NODE_1507_length_4269_cov_2.695923_6_plen_89_part_01